MLVPVFLQLVFHVAALENSQSLFEGLWVRIKNEVIKQRGQDGTSQGTYPENLQG